MKKKIIVATALFLGIVLAALASSNRAALAQNQMRVVADTGVITLGPNQILRVSGDGVDQDDPVTLRFRRIRYAQGNCDGGICRLAVASQTTSQPVTLVPNEIAVVDAADYTVWRMVVLGNRRNVRVTAAIIDATTGETVSHFILPYMEQS